MVAGLVVLVLLALLGRSLLADLGPKFGDLPGGPWPEPATRALLLPVAMGADAETTGVLIVGPSRSFLQYIEAVLPSLGETGVVLASVGQLYPGLDTALEDPAEVAELKGSLTMVGLLARAVRSAIGNQR